MTKHIGVKLINAFPMTRQAYNDFRGWQLPAGENGEDEGYLVEYLDGGKPNTDRFDGYVSWSPKEVFEKAYRPVSGLSFGLAMEALKQGKSLQRAGWNGKDQFVYLVKGEKLASALGYGFGEYVGEPTFNDTLVLKNSQNRLATWVPSIGDLMAEDWQII
ncbi:DUF2829 domain-containing protein [Escherichia coli]|uniref:DUF2829 domain-containing protein n=1 Tax=Escherichia coli TaxID=562 RepID=UPI0021BEB811|nr:DUF2829 domain-containing protein [Escherichia coli]EGN4327740.1 DUF2829 domain-containing protein [Escherichia coli]ELO4876621.1 DUF2829 domain-containing protein [Escherichia coli]MCT9744954.1 DUF2829 domain-containing protein [Escherichia coli]